MTDSQTNSNPTQTAELEAGTEEMKLEAGTNPQALPDGEDLAAAALADSTVSGADTDQAELDASNQLADELNSLQNLIERHARELGRIDEELKQKRESLKNVFDNDTELNEAQAQLTVFSEQLKERRSKMQADPQVVGLKVTIGELNDQKKELEETLSNHLVNYHQLTNSTSFDTSDGDQWEFNIKAKIKPRK